MTTYFDEIRDQQAYRLARATPSVLSRAKFVRHDAMTDFRVWAEDNATAAFRRFHLADLWSREEVVGSNLDAELKQVEQELLIAYPDDFRYGADDIDDKRDVIRADAADTFRLAGTLGSCTTWPGFTAHADRWTLEELDGVTVLVVTLTLTFWEEVGAIFRKFLDADGERVHIDGAGVWIDGDG